MDQDLKTLEFDVILNMLCGEAVSEEAKERLRELRPEMRETVCLSRMAETTEARRVLDALGTPPLAVMADLRKDLDEALKGGMLSPQQMSGIAAFCASVRSLKRYYERARGISPVIASRQCTLPDLNELEEKITSSVREDEVLDEASVLLRDLRRKTEHKDQEIREKLMRVMQQHKKLLSDSYVTERSGRAVLPVQKKYQSIFPGRVVEASSRGSTVFMEPSAVEKAAQEKEKMMILLDAEERRILWELTACLLDREEELLSAAREMTEADILFAKAKLSALMGGREVKLSPEKRICLVEARHPLLSRENCVPLNLSLESPDTGIAITGPNTGGKTVTLKTVGLMCVMAQSGLHVPCGPGTVLTLRDRVFCDIGDSQSISQNLSTFSGHMKNVIRILEECSPDSLVLLDEPGSGTDPAEGSGIAIAVLEELIRRESLFLTTTHDPRVKSWSEQTPCVQPARMAFDRASLQPLFILEQGLSGESCAIEIAKRLGMEERLLRRAREASGSRQEREGQGTEPVPVSSQIPSAGRIPRGNLRREKQPAEISGPVFEKGDSVQLLPEHKNAIVYEKADDTGNVVIHLQGRFLTVNRKRLQLLVPAKELYPPDYDFSIIFDTVQNRKAAHTMSRKNDPEAMIVYREGKKDR